MKEIGEGKGRGGSGEIERRPPSSVWASLRCCSLFCQRDLLAREMALSGREIGFFSPAFGCTHNCLPVQDNSVAVEMT